MKFIRHVCAIAAFACTLQAADPTGSIAGNIKDPSGAAVVGATVTILAPATGLTRTTKSLADGGYVLPLLPPGTYNVSIQAAGFKTFDQRGIDLKADAALSVPVTLQLGAVSDTVTVQANAELVDTRSGTLRQVVDEARINELPLQGRNATSLVTLAPGTNDLNQGNARGSGDAMQQFTYPGAQSVSANGARSDGVNYLLDGGGNVDPYTNVNSPIPNPDALEEFSVQTNNFSAEQGRASGAVVNVVTKSGTNDFHGSLFEYLRNGDLNARNFFASEQDKLKRNQFGGSLGGRIIKDKLFFFGTYQGTQLRSPGSTGNRDYVPTAAERNGDFSALLPQTQLVDPVTRKPFANNRIPSSMLDPAAMKMLSLIPTRTSPDGALFFNQPQNEHENQYMGRIDWNRTGKQRIYGRFFQSHYIKQGVSGAESMLAMGPGFDFTNTGISGSQTYTYNEHLLTNTTFSLNKNVGNRVSNSPYSPKDLGINVAAPDPSELTIGVNGYFWLTSGRPGVLNRQNLHWTSSTHYMTGIHDIAFGGEFLHMSVDLNNGFRMSGAYNFSGTNNTGNVLADFLIGRMLDFRQGGGTFSARRGNLPSLFVQDSMRLTPRLNVNVGLRWDPFLPYGDTQARTPCFRPGQTSIRYPLAPVGLVFGGDPGCNSGAADPSYWQFGPRAGFAYKLDDQGKTSIRGGAGIFYQPPFAEAFNEMVNIAPFSPQVHYRNVPFSNPYAGKTNPFPAAFGPNLPGPTAAFATPLTGASYDADWRQTRVMSWNLTLERALRKDVLARVSYVASKGTHLTLNTDANAPMYQGGGVEGPRPYQQFGQMVMATSAGNSLYNSLQVSVEKRFSHGFTIDSNYTYGKSIDDTSFNSDLDTVNAINPSNFRAYRGLSDFSLAHSFKSSFVWQVPGPTKGFARYIAGGWQTSGIWTWQGGFPLNITSGDDNSLTEIYHDQADLVGPVTYTSGSRAQKMAQWFSPSAFATNKVGTFGTAGRNILRGPGTFNVDFSAQKSFNFTERMKLTYRAEFFNVLNHPELGNPYTSVSDGNRLGQIDWVRDGRIAQMALRLTF